MACDALEERRGHFGVTQDKLPVALQLQLLEADHLDDTKIGALADGGRPRK
jgi:hypothetical protein